MSGHDETLKGADPDKENDNSSQTLTSTGGGSTPTTRPLNVFAIFANKQYPQVNNETACALGNQELEDVKTNPDWYYVYSRENVLYRDSTGTYKLPNGYYYGFEVTSTSVNSVIPKWDRYGYFYYNGQDLPLSSPTPCVVVEEEEEQNITTQTSDPTQTTIPFGVNITVERHVTIPLRTIISEILETKFNEKFEETYDDNRVGKTLLNLRNDRQIPVLNWKSVGEFEYDEDGTITGYPEIALKLSEPLDTTQYPLNTSAFVSREMLSSVFDRLRFITIDDLLIPQLRPAINVAVGKSSRVTATLEELIPNIAGGTGAANNIDSEYRNFVTNGILENLYNENSGMDVNINYSNFDKFVTFGSAQKRLDVFKAKLQQIEQYIVDAPVFIENLNISASSADEGTYETVFGTLVVDSSGNSSLTGSSNVYNMLTSSATPPTDFVNSSINTSIKVQELIRGFDGYEKELWFRTGLQYTSSNGEYYHSIQYQKDDYTYPKILGIPLATTHASASIWYTEMSTIATDYDNDNQNILSKNVPTYIQEDEFSSDFVTFTEMIGHHFDNVKTYITNLENISSRYPKVYEEISGDMAKKVLESFGISAPSIASVEKLINYVTGNNTNDPYKDIANEYYKRYLHALPFLLRTKGTKQSVNSLLNVFGINPDIITVKENISNRYTSLEPKKVTTTEQDFVLTIPSGSYLTVPFSASLRNPQTIQARFALLDDRTQDVFKFDNDYSIKATFHPSGSTNTYYTNTGRIDLMSASVALVTSSYFDLFDENYVSLQLKYDSAGAILDIRKIENEDTTFSQSLQETQMSMSADWSGLSELYIGIPAASSSGATDYTSASLDEFRMWGDTITQAKFIEFAENPGMYAGNTYTSSLEDLYVRLSFNLPTDVYTTGSIPNTTPYVSKSEALDLTNISGSQFPTRTSPLYNTSRIIRSVTQNSYFVSDTTDMIRIAPEPPTTMSLSSTDTTVDIYEKFLSSSVATNELDISISPVDAIDREIIRSFGNIQLGQYLGDPQDTNRDNYSQLDTLESVFIRELAPTINHNGFVRFFDKFLNNFYESVEQFLPARSKIRKGIVIRSNILNRTKVNNRENIKFSGETSRRSQNFEHDAIYSFDTNISTLKGNPNQLLSTEIYGLFNNKDSSYSLNNFGAIIDSTALTSMQGSYDYYQGTTRLRDKQFIFGDMIGNTSSFAALEAVLPRTYKENITANVWESPIGIGPHCDLFSIPPNSKFSYVREASTYFDSPYGLYYVDQQRYVPITSSYMLENGGPTDRGTWTSGESYRRGDVVLQPVGTTGLDGTPLSKNGRQFAFTAVGYEQNQYVQSTQPPELDAKWSLVGRKSEIYQKLVRVINVTGSYREPGKYQRRDGQEPVYVTGSLVQIKTSVVTDLAITGSYPSEYTHRHFIFCRDETLGGLRRTYLGTLNTKSTSADGGFPYEIFNIEGNELTVGSPEPCADCD